METSHFLRLSPELRNRIYELVFGQGGLDQCCITIALIDQKHLVANDTFRKHVALTQSCQQVRSECRLFCFADRHFSLSLGDPDLKRWGYKPLAHMCPVGWYLETVLGVDVLSAMGRLTIVYRAYRYLRVVITTANKEGTKRALFEYWDPDDDDDMRMKPDKVQAMFHPLGSIYRTAGFVEEWRDQRGGVVGS